MPHSFNGIGTTYFGKREEEADGSYITTEWISFLYCPLFPLGSYRVKPTGETDSTYLVVYASSNERYLVRPVSLNLRQVRNVYLGLYGWIPVFAVLIYFLKASGT